MSILISVGVASNSQFFRAKNVTYSSGSETNDLPKILVEKLLNNPTNIFKTNPSIILQFFFH